MITLKFTKEWVIVCKEFDIKIEIKATSYMAAVRKLNFFLDEIKSRDYENTNEEKK